MDKFYAVAVLAVTSLVGCSEDKVSYDTQRKHHKAELRALCIQKIEKEIGHSGLFSARVTDYYQSRGGYALVIRYTDKGRERAATCGAPFKQALTANDVNLVNDFGGF